MSTEFAVTREFHEIIAVKRLLEALITSSESFNFTEAKANLELLRLADSRYEPNKRSGAWVKWKCGFEQEFVIGGYAQGKGKRTDFGALIVGYYDGATFRRSQKDKHLYL